VPADVEDHLVALLPVREVLTRVVDDVVGAKGANQVHLRRAAHAGHVSPEHLGHLHGVRPHATGRTNDQHLLVRAHPGVVA
jgi:hypothetical protein